MKGQGKFKFIELKKRNGGVFTNSEGKEIPYKESYALKVNEQTEDGIYERIFKLATDSELIPQLSQLKPYQDFVLEFDVNIYNTRVTLLPVAIKN